VIRRLVVSVALLVVILAAADYGLRLYSQSVVGGEVKAALDLSEKPSVSFGGWPFITHMLSGDLSSASFSAATFSSHGVRLRKVTVALEAVRFPSGRLLSGGGGTIHAKRGHGSATLTAEDVNAALRHDGVPLTVRIRDGRASVGVQGLTVGLDVKLEGSSLVLSPSAVGVVSEHIALPSIVRGLRYTSVALDGSEVVLRFTLRNAVFVIPPSA
jgi:hypothetical protein